MYQQPSASERIKTFFKGKSVLPKLILINILVWGIINIVSLFVFLFTQKETGAGTESWERFILDYFAVPANWEVFLHRPWTIVSYMFLHLDFWHLLFNMLWLYWFGKIFLEFLTNRHLLLVYFVGGIAGALAFMIAFNVFPVFSDHLNGAIALGASASVLAIVVSISTLVPNYRLNLFLFGSVKLKYIMLATILMDVFMIPRGSNAGGHLAHLGGALAGAVFVLFLKQNVHLPSALTFKRFKPRMKKHSQKETENIYVQRPITDDEYNSQRAKMQERIDTILDKISKSGYASLNKEEKELLFKFSNKK